MHRFSVTIRTRGIAFSGSADVYAQSSPEQAEALLRAVMAEPEGSAMRVRLEQTLDEEPKSGSIQ